MGNKQPSEAFEMGDYRYPGEVWSLVVTFTLIALFFALIIWIFPISHEQVLKVFIITLAGVAVYVVIVFIQQRTAIGTLVRVGPRQFHDINDLSVSVAERLSMRPVPVYIERSSSMNIYLLGLWRKPLIVITSSMVDQLDTEDLRFYIAREMSHVLAGHTLLRVILKPLGSDVMIIGKLLNNLIFGDWINRSELTADRGGFIVCGSLTTAVKAMLKFGVGVNLFSQLDIQEFLDQIHDVSNMSGRVTEMVAGQLYLTQRVRALTEFALSDRGQQATHNEHAQTRIIGNLPDSFIHPVGITEKTKATKSLLVATAGNEKYFLLKKCTSIGRSPENDIVVKNSRVSRYHAEIILHGEEFYIVDKDSINGVWLNGRKISEPTRLTPGDRVLISKLEYVFATQS